MPEDVRPSRVASCGAGRIAMRLPPALTQSLEHRRLRSRQRHLAEDRDVVLGEDGRVDGGDVHGLEGVQALGPQDLGVVAREGVARVADDEDRAARPLLGRRRRRGLGGEGPGVVRGERIAGDVRDAAAAALHRRGVRRRVRQGRGRAEWSPRSCSRSHATVAGTDEAAGVTEEDGGAGHRARRERLAEPRADGGADEDAGRTVRRRRGQHGRGGRVRPRRVRR